MMYWTTQHVDVEFSFSLRKKNSSLFGVYECMKEVRIVFSPKTSTPLPCDPRGSCF